MVNQYFLSTFKPVACVFSCADKLLLMVAAILDSNNISIGIHFFKVLVQIHYSRFPGWGGVIIAHRIGYLSVLLPCFHLFCLIISHFQVICR